MIIDLEMIWPWLNIYNLLFIPQHYHSLGSLKHNFTSRCKPKPLFQIPKSYAQSRSNFRSWGRCRYTPGRSGSASNCWGSWGEPPQGLWAGCRNLVQPSISADSEQCVSADNFMWSIMDPGVWMSEAQVNGSRLRILSLQCARVHVRKLMQPYCNSLGHAGWYS